MPAFHLTSLGSAYTIIVCVTGSIWTLQTLAIRYFIRLKIHGPVGWDNILCTVASILAIINSGLTILGSRYGLGQDIDDLSNYAVVVQQILSWISNQFLLSALCFSRLAICFLIARVTQRTKQVRISYAIAALNVLWAVMAMPTVAFNCGFDKPWLRFPRSRCTNLYRVWTGITLSSTLLEIATSIAAVKLVASVRMSWRAKATVLAAFTIRLLVVPPNLARLHYIHQTLHSTNWTYSRIRVVIITQVVLHVSVILATVPCIKPWLVAFETGGLQSPADARKISTMQRSSRTPFPSPMLEPRALDVSTHHSTIPAASLARPSKTLLRRTTSHDSTAYAPGAAGHRRRVEAWPLRTYEQKATYSVSAEYAPAEQSHQASRKASKSSSASSGITRMKSFGVSHEDRDDYFTATASVEGERGREGNEGDTASGGRELTTLSLNDAGGLLGKERMISPGGAS